MPAPLGGHPLPGFLCAVGLLLFAALLLGRLANRFGLPAVSGELCAVVALAVAVLGKFSGAPCAVGPAGWVAGSRSRWASG